MNFLWVWLKINLCRLRGKWRLWWGFCPQCNSDAPNLYDCPVCHYYHQEYPPPKELRAVWWKRFQNELYVPPGYRGFIETLKERSKS